MYKLHIMLTSVNYKIYNSKILITSAPETMFLDNSQITIT